MSAAELVPFALLGLAGSLHCAGMCGPLALSVGLAGSHSRRATSAIAGYLLGKAAMYAVLSLAVAALASELGSVEPRWLAYSRGALAWIAGLVMVLVALSGLGWLGRVGRLSFAPLERALRSAFAASGELPAPLRGFAFGAANGLLPCGLSWAAIALGAASAPVLAALGPFVFGLATAPVLAMLAFGGRAVPVGVRIHGRRIAAVLLLAFGVWTIGRAGPLAPTAIADTAPDCCQPEASPGGDVVEPAPGR